MAHKSKKKHLKHLRSHQRASASSNAKSEEMTEEAPSKHRGIVRSIAHAAKEKIVGEEKKIAKKVKSLLG